MRQYGLIGFPLGHSFSQRYFAEKFQKEGIENCSYTNFPIEKIEKIEEVLREHPDLQGFNVEKALEINPQAKGVYLSPASQYPLGVPLSDDRADDLLDWAHRKDGWIIEDGTDGAISLGGHPYRSLLGRDGNSETVAYIESFSLLISPSFRIGYIVLPEAFAEVCTAAKYLSTMALRLTT